MWVNLASGEHPAPEPWINVDKYVIKGHVPDVMADIFDLPFETNSVDKFFLSHILEHIAFSRMPEFFSEILRTGRPGAEAMVNGPDIKKAIATEQPQWLLDGIYAKPYDPNCARPGLAHLWTADEDSTCLAMMLGGLVAVRPIDIADCNEPWPRVTDAPWQCAAIGYVP